MDYLIDHICNSEGPEYRTKLKCETDEGDVGKLKKTAGKEKEKAAKELRGGEPGPNTRSKKTASKSAGQSAASAGNSSKLKRILIVYLIDNIGM